MTHDENTHGVYLAHGVPTTTSTTQSTPDWHTVHTNKGKQRSGVLIDKVGERGCMVCVVCVCVCVHGGTCDHKSVTALPCTGAAAQRAGQEQQSQLHFTVSWCASNIPHKTMGGPVSVCVYYCAPICVYGSIATYTKAR